jgi:hypothetical protein
VASVGRSGDDQRGARLVDEDRVDLVDDRVVQRGVLAEHELVGAERHVVAEEVEAELAVGEVGDVATVVVAARLVVVAVLDDGALSPRPR